MRTRPALTLVLVLALAAGLVAALWLLGGDGGTSADRALASGAPAPAPPAAGARTEAAPELGDAGPDSGSAAAERAALVAPPATVVAAEAEPARALTGRVVDRAGKPVAGASILGGPGGGFDVLALDEMPLGRGPWMQRAQAESAADGRFTIQPTGSGAVRIAVRAAGFAPLDVERAARPVDGDLGDLVVEAGIVLEGRVIDAFGAGVAGAELVRRSADAPPFAFFGRNVGAVVARTDASGAFRVDQLRAGPWILGVRSDAHPDQDERGTTTRPGEVVRGIVIQLEEGFEIAGRLSGAPPAELARLEVVAGPTPPFAAENANRDGPRHGALAPDGSFVVRGLRRDARYRLSARVAGEQPFRAPSRSNSVEATSGERGVELRWRDETALVFQVVDARTGAPVTALTVSAGDRWLAQLMDAQGRAVREFPEGRVRYGGLRLAPGAQTVSVRVEATGYATHEQKDIAVVEGEDNDLGRVLLEPTAVVRVRVRSKADGTPIAGARVTLDEVFDEGDPAAGLRSFAFGLESDDEVVLPRFGPGGGAQRARTDSEGVAVLTSLPGKRARVAVSHREHAPWESAPIDLPVGRDHELEASLLRGGDVVVTVLDPAGVAVPGEHVQHREAGAEDAIHVLVGRGPGTESDALGRVTFRHLPAGLHEFQLGTAGGPIVMRGGGMARIAGARFGGDEEAEAPWAQVAVTEGGTHALTLVAPERAQITGRVLEGGAPLAGATVTLATGDDELGLFEDSSRASTDGSGNFVIERVTLGEQRLTVRHPSRAMEHSAEVQVRKGENRVEIALPLATIEGRVRGEDGEPLPGVRVRAERAGGESAVRSIAVMIDEGDGARTFSDGPGGSVETGADGVYVLRGVEPGVELAVVAGGGAFQQQRSEPVRLAQDELRRGVDVTLRPGAELEVVCKLPSGAPATPCEVRAEPTEAGSAAAEFEITGRDGKARFRGLQPGRWRVSARAFGPDHGGTVSEQTVELAPGKPTSIAITVQGG